MNLQLTLILVVFKIELVTWLTLVLNVCVVTGLLIVVVTGLFILVVTGLLLITDD